MSLDQFLDRVYHPQHYNCAHFVCEVLTALSGREVSSFLRGFLTGAELRTAVLSDLRRVRWLRNPESPCIVLLQRPRCEPHVGIWWEGRVLHLTPRGVQYMPLEVVSLGFKRVRFLKC